MTPRDELVVTGPDPDGVVTLTLNRPGARNALSIALRDLVSDALRRFVDDDGVKVVVVTGAGSAFCSGFDVGEFASADACELWSSSDRFHHAVMRFPLPTVARVNGPALGGGFDLAVMCDIRIASDRASFAHPEQAFGDVVYGPLHEMVGGAFARELAFTGRSVTAAEALSRGIVSQVVRDSELDDAVKRLTTQICRAPRAQLARTKAKAIARTAIPLSTATLDL